MLLHLIQMEMFGFSSLGGITKYDGTNFTTFDTANGLLSQYATDLIIDSYDNKWVGTARARLFWMLQIHLLLNILGCI